MIGEAVAEDQPVGHTARVNTEVHIDRISEFIVDIITAHGIHQAFTVRFNPDTDAFRNKGMLSVEVIDA